jgi:hypothetical protein
MPRRVYATQPGELKPISAYLIKASARRMYFVP